MWPSVPSETTYKDAVRTTPEASARTRRNHVDIERHRHLELVQAVLDLVDDVVPRSAPAHSLRTVVARARSHRLEARRALGAGRVGAAVGRPVLDIVLDGATGTGVENGRDPRVAFEEGRLFGLPATHCARVEALPLVCGGRSLQDLVLIPIDAIEDLR